LQQVGDFSELNVKLRCQKVNATFISKLPVFFLRFCKIAKSHC